jgi:3-phenylpropionate/trans-cinnamate dioxygenase ferredoxin reductase subunit
VLIELGASVSGFESRDGQVSAVRLADGRSLPCEVAVVGIGAQAQDGLAAQAGLSCRDGIVVDELCRTSDPSIHAIGDCTQRPLPRYGASMRLESVPNALEQARQAAADVCGKPAVKSDVPWFWSDQYDVRLQIVGLPRDVASKVVRGDPSAGKFCVFHLDADGVLQALEAVNSPGEFAAARQWVGARQLIDPTRAADTRLSPKQIIEVPA